jgi:rare lipoprotein A
MLGGETMRGSVLLLFLCACSRPPAAGGEEARAPRSADESVGTYAPPPRDEVQIGYATWYGGKFTGRKTASGERFDPSQMTAAHRTLPFGTWVEVKRVETGAMVRVRITDRGPFGHEERIIDLSRGAAERIGLVRAGLAKVEVRVVEGP